MFNREYIFRRIIFHCHVSLPEGKFTVPGISQASLASSWRWTIPPAPPPERWNHAAPRPPRDLRDVAPSAGPGRKMTRFFFGGGGGKWLVWKAFLLGKVGLLWFHKLFWRILKPEMYLVKYKGDMIYNFMRLYLYYFAIHCTWTCG